MTSWFIYLAAGFDTDTHVSFWATWQEQICWNVSEFFLRLGWEWCWGVFGSLGHLTRFSFTFPLWAHLTTAVIFWDPTLSAPTFRDQAGSNLRKGLSYKHRNFKTLFSERLTCPLPLLSSATRWRLFCSIWRFLSDHSFPVLFSMLFLRMCNLM